MSKDTEDTINLIGFKGVILGIDNPSENPLNKSEVNEFLQLIKSNRDVEMFATGCVYGLAVTNGNRGLKAEVLRQVHKMTLDYMNTLAYQVNQPRGIEVE